MKPKDLQKGQKFRIRATTNSRRYVVNGLVLKICKENGFKPGEYPSWEHDHILVPIEFTHGVDRLILKPDTEIYLL